MNASLVFPLFAMFILNFIVALVMFSRRISAVKSGQIRIGYFKTYKDSNIPDSVIQADRHFTNLFEAPVLFYVVCILGVVFSEGFAFTSFAWLFVAARFLHAWIHMGSNKLRFRMTAYFVGWLCLLILWGLLIYHQIFPTQI